MKQIPFHPYVFTPVTKFNAKKKCATCAYHVQPRPEEDEMTIAYWQEHPVPHQCHERQNGWACVGSVESFKRLGLEITQRGK